MEGTNKSREVAPTQQQKGNATRIIEWDDDIVIDCDTAEEEKPIKETYNCLNRLGKARTAANSDKKQQQKKKKVKTATFCSSNKSSASNTTRTSSTTAATTSGPAGFAMVKERIDQYNDRYHGDYDDDDDSYSTYDYERDELVPAMAVRAYHLPDYGWCADWVQYFCNTHPLFGMCFHHRAHPVKWPTRFLQLLGSIVFGLLVTNLIWLFMVYENERDTERPVVTIDVGALNETKLAPLANLTNTDGDGDGTTIEITEGMVFLWTVGGTLHALFDNTVWYLTACVCCLPGQALEKWAGLKRYGVILLIFTVIAIGAVSSFLVVLRATLQDNEGTQPSQAGLEDDELNPLTDWDDKSSFKFLLSYIVEVVLAMLVYYPLVGTVLFSGILGCCGRIPILGGRPYEVAMEEKRERRRDSNSAKDITIKSGGDDVLGHRRTHSSSSSEDLQYLHRPSDYALRQQERREREEQELSSSKRSRSKSKRESKRLREQDRLDDLEEEEPYQIARSIPRSPSDQNQRSYRGSNRYDDSSDRFADDYPASPKRSSSSYSSRNADLEDGIRVSGSPKRGRSGSSTSRKNNNSKAKKAAHDDDGIRIFSAEDDFSRRPPKSNQGSRR